MGSSVDRQGEDRFRSYLRTTGGAMTAQRKTVLKAIAGMGPHFGTEELVARLRRSRRGASRATVYRTVAHLERSGIVRKVDFGEAHAHYESVLSRAHHEHLRCRRCGRVLEVRDGVLERRIEALARMHAFTLEKHTVQMVGLCRECRSNGHSGT